MPIKLIGKNVILEEINEKYFECVIKWRNNKTLNRFLNQSFELTIDLQKKWFEKYLKDDTQCLLIMIDKNNQEPFGTIGWTDLDKDDSVCIMGRLLVGNHSYNGSYQLIEGMMLHSDYVHRNLNIGRTYIHVVKENKKVLNFNKRWGYLMNEGVCKYPNELFVNGMHQFELYRSKENYETSRQKICELLKVL